MLTRFSSSDDAIVDFYRVNGYVLLTALLAPTELTRARSEIFELFETAFDGDAELAEERLLEHYDVHDPNLWQQCARRMWDLLCVFELAAVPNVERVLRRLGLAAPMVSTRPEVLAWPTPPSEEAVRAVFVAAQ